jgi:single-stranded-DNA-specific exonuclease
VARQLLQPADLDQVIETDGALDQAQLSLELAEAIEAQVWGQGFAAPLFCNEFDVLEQRVVGGRHSRLRLRPAEGGGIVEAIRFGEDAPLPSPLRIVYRLQVNEFNGTRSPQLVIERWSPVP